MRGKVYEDAQDMRPCLRIRVGLDGGLHEHSAVHDVAFSQFQPPNLTIHFGTEDMHPSPEAKKRVQRVGKVPVQIRLQLKPGDGYYTFYEGKVPLKEGESKAAPGGI